MSATSSNVVRVYLVNDAGDTWYSDWPIAVDVDTAVTLAEQSQRDGTGDESWCMTEWSAA